MSTSSAEKAILRVRGADAFTEVRVLDARFEKVQLTANSGNVEVALTPGLYEVGFRRGGAWRTQEVALPEAGVSLDIAAPVIESTGWTELPDLVAVRNADPSNIVLELQERDGALLPLGEADGIEVGLIGEDGSTTRPYRDTALVAGTWRFFAHSGHWILRIRTDPSPNEQAIEIPLTLGPGWALHIVGTIGRYDPASRGRTGSGLELDLDRLRIRMVGADDSERGLSPKLLAHEESALASLAAGRALFGESFRTFLRGAFRHKLKNPMMGIYAAHILACSWTPDSEPIDDVLDNLDRWTRRHPSDGFDDDVGANPDVAALKLRFALLQGRPLDGYEPIAFPPVLMAGWKALIEAALQRPDLIVPGSLCESVASRLLGSSLWVAWHDEAQPTALPAAAAARSVEPAQPPAMAFDSARDIIVSGLAHSSLREWYRHARSDPLKSETPQPLIVSDEMAAVASLLRPILGTEKNETAMMRASLGFTQISRPKDASATAEALRLPLAAVEAAASGLAHLLVREARSQGIDLERRTAMARPEMIIPYDPAFLGDGFIVPMPELGDRPRAQAFGGGAVIDYIHYSLVMHEQRRIALFTANNIDGARKVSIRGGLTWRMDERLGDLQLGRETYESKKVDRFSQFDKGHLVRREDVLWGPVAEARAANKATYFYPNAAPQHENFNQDEWKSLEDWVLQRATDLSYRLCVFTGPVLTDEDPVLADLPQLGRARALAPAQVPAAFWKVIVLRDSEAGGGDLAAIAFAMKQNDMWNDKQGKRLLDLKLHQVTIAAIEEWTGLDFGSLKEVDEFAFSPARSAGKAPFPTVRGADDIIWSGPLRRAQGHRALPMRRSEAPMRHGGHHDAECCKQNFDARRAIEALGRDIARLTSLIDRGSAAEAPQGRSRSRSAAAPPDREAVIDDPRVEAMAAAAPEALKDKLRAFARGVTEQSDVARGLRPPAAPRELTRIVGGQEVGPGGYPHCVCVGEPDQWMCTGALVAPQVVLTAAHCGHSISRVAIGNLVTPLLGPGTRVVPVQRVAVHPGYLPYPLSENDISVLILAAPALVPPVPMAPAEALEAAAAVDLVGFGYNDPERPLGFGTKRHVRIDLPLILPRDGENMSVLEQLLGFHGGYEFVAGRKGLGRDTCNGDSGGPAYVMVGNEMRLAGLTSRATREAVVNCGDAGIYVRPTAFRIWIDGIVSSSGLPPIAW